MSVVITWLLVKPPWFSHCVDKRWITASSVSYLSAAAYSAFSARLPAISAHQTAHRTRSRFGVVVATCFVRCTLLYLFQHCMTDPAFLSHHSPLLDYLYPISGHIPRIRPCSTRHYMTPRAGQLFTQDTCQPINNNKHLRCGNRKGLLGRNDQTHHRMDPNTMASRPPTKQY